MKTIIIIYLLVIAPFAAIGQGAAGSAAVNETRYTIDMPTAGMLAKSSFAVRADFFDGGGIMADFAVSPFTNFELGISYAVNNFIGGEKPEFPELPGVNAKFRIINEKSTFPALAIGINTQGAGRWLGGIDRYMVCSPGAYLAASKNFLWWPGDISLHGGINYSFEPRPEDRSPNGYIGIEQSLGGSLALNFEYNLYPGADGHKMWNSGGLLSTSLRWSVARGLTLELQLRDLLNSRNGSDSPVRFVRFYYSSGF
ncbi:MAG: hypothetical protein ACLFQU_00015 [Candidatus Kapaibacterium sp.]